MGDRAARGLYFRRDDYARFWLRVLVDLIDFVVVGFICVAAAVIIMNTSLPNASDVTLACCAVVIYGYFVPLKRSRIRTLGYRVGRVKIVGIDGQPPGWFALTLRLGFAALGPLNMLIDLTWLAGDRHRQALRDKFAQTYVVKVSAEPAGSGKIVYQYYDILGYNFLFREVAIEEATAS